VLRAGNQVDADRALADAATIADLRQTGCPNANKWCRLPRTDTCGGYQMRLVLVGAATPLLAGSQSSATTQGTLAGYGDLQKRGGLPASLPPSSESRFMFSAAKLVFGGHLRRRKH
jgi:hypothetical protein